MTAEMIYALMAIVPAIILTIMVILGFDTDADIDMDADVDLDVDVDVDADIDSGIDSEVTTGGGPGPFSLKLMLGFITGFGAFGYFAEHFDWYSSPIITAFLGGFMIYYLVYRLVKILYDFQANSQTSGMSLIGKEALVINQIAEGGTGEIKVKDPRTGNSIVFRAQAELQTPVNKGDAVRILNIRGNLAKVRSMNPQDSDLKSVIKHSQITEDE